MKHGQGEMEQTDLGAKRESNKGRGRFDLLPYEAMEALAIWFEQGAEKYEDRNWEKGISVKDCVNRMIRHALKAGSGWTDEDHLAAVMWNAAVAITMRKRMPACNDHKWLEETKEVVDEVKRKEYEKVYYKVPVESADEIYKSRRDDSMDAVAHAVNAMMEMQNKLNMKPEHPWCKYKK